MVVNAHGEDWTVAPAVGQDGTGPRIALARGKGGWSLMSGEHIFQLPAAFEPSIDQQFRFRKAGEGVDISWEGLRLGTVQAPAGPTRIALGTTRGAASFEAVRVTAIPQEKR
jgi:hypothetical protein